MDLKGFIVIWRDLAMWWIEVILHIDNHISVLNQEIDVKIVLGELMMLYCDI